MNSQRKFFRFMIRRARSSFGVIVSYRFSSTHWVRLMFSRTRHRAFDMACDTPIILDFSLGESSRRENHTTFSRITVRIIIGMLPIRFEMIICTQRRLTIECDQHKCATLHLGPFGKISTFKKADRDWTKVIVDHKALSEGHETFFRYCQETFIDVDIFPPAVRQNSPTSWVIPRHWWQTVFMMHSNANIQPICICWCTDSD